MPALPRAGEVSAVHHAPQFHVTRFRALLDTGADGTSICSHVARSQNLVQMGRRTVIGIGGPNKHFTWSAFLGFFFPQDADFEGDAAQSTGFFMVPDALLAVEIPDNQWFDVLIGRDILTQFDFTIKRGGIFELNLR